MPVVRSVPHRAAVSPSVPCSRLPLTWGALALVLLLAACAGGPRSGGGQGGGFYQQDGPGDLGRLQGIDLADAVPRIEPLMSGPNKPYTVLGRSYTPDTRERPFRQSGVASWYGKQFHGRQTSSGEPYDMYAMTAAHPTLPIPSYARVTSLASGRSVIVRVNDRGPFLASRVIDLSYAAAYKLGYLDQGSMQVTVERILPTEIRAGNWQRQPAPLLAGASPAATVVTRAADPQSAPDADPIAGFAAAAASPALVGDAPAFRVAEIAPLAPQASTSGAADPLPMLDRPGVYLQLGAFRSADGAADLARHLSSEASGEFDLPLGVQASGGWFRLQTGPYPSRGQAHSAAERVRAALGMSPVLVER